MTTFLYNKKDLEILNKEKTHYRLLIILCSLAIFFSLTLCLILANYENQKLFKIIFASLVTVEACFLIYLTARFIYSKRLVNEYEILLNSDKSKVKVEVLSISKHIITLPDKSRCYEINVNENKTKRTYYLSEIFEPSFVIGNKYIFSISFDYITEFKDEK